MSSVSTSSRRVTCAFASSALSLLSTRRNPTTTTFLRRNPLTHASSPVYSKAPLFRRSYPTMVLSASKDSPGVLDTDPSGGVLIASRTGPISVVQGPPAQDYRGDLLVVACWANEDASSEDASSSYKLPQSFVDFDSAIANGALQDLVADSDFSGKSGATSEVLRLASTDKGPKRIVLVGLGKRSSASSSAPSVAAKLAVTKGMAIKSCESVAVLMDSPTSSDITALTEGAMVGAYIDERYKEKKDASKVPTEFSILQVDNDASEAIARGAAIAMGIITTKEVISAPANCLTPATLAVAAETVAKECGLEVKILGRDECAKLGMGAYLGVGRGSTDEPKFIHMTYRPQGTVSKKVCIVGKAVTFDTGGTNLKTGAGSMIELMKFDMGGSAVALGSAKVIGELKPKDVEVHFIMPAVENMIGDRAIHPGDILKASNGKTVEVINTDAEGRLCLADGLVYAEKLGEVDYIVDIATLTGAIIVSLGNDVCGMWSGSDEMAGDLLEASKSVGEGMWRMPLVDEYVEQLKSKIADLRNIGTGRAGGSIIAALFLREFVKTKNWAHLDIAGTVWQEKKGGATGYGVKTMVQWIENMSK